jgi:hypothetical protein
MQGCAFVAVQQGGKVGCAFAGSSPRRPGTTVPSSNSGRYYNSLLQIRAAGGRIGFRVCPDCHPGVRPDDNTQQ